MKRLFKLLPCLMVGSCALSAGPIFYTSLTSLPAGWSSMPGTGEAPSFDTGKAKANDNPESTCTSGTHKLSRPTTKETKRSIIMTTVSDVDVSEINARRR